MVETGMKIKKVQSDSVRNAMRRIRREFGADAVILNTRNLNGNSDGDSEAKVEVTAGIYQQTPPSPEPEAPESEESHVATREHTEETRKMRKTMLKMQETIERLTVDLQHPDIQHLPDQYREWYLYLVNQEVDTYLIKNMIRDAMKMKGKQATHEEIREYLEQVIDSIFMESPSPVMDDEQRIIAVVGPTGVGKTTTIAKLATQKSLEEGRRVALITADTYRVAATDQITTFAHLLELPIQVVYTSREMEEALQKFTDYDYIYIDTTGRSQNDRENILQIQQILEAADPHEMHLVLSATTSTATLRSVANKFSLLPVTELLISKIDESEAAGSVLSLLQQYSWPVSYFTNGQNVPEDIMVGSAAGYCQLLFGEME